MDNAASAVQGCVSGWLTVGNDTSECIRHGEGWARYPIGAFFFSVPPPIPRTHWRSVLFNFYAFHHVYLLLTSAVSGVYLHDAFFSTCLRTLCPVIRLHSRLSRPIITSLLQAISMKWLGT